MTPDDLELDPLFADEEHPGEPWCSDGTGLIPPIDEDPELAAERAKNAALDAYRAKGKDHWKLNDVVHTTEKGFYFVCDFFPDGKPKFRHRVKPNPNFGKGKPSPNPLGKGSVVKDTAAYIREQTGDGKELYDFYLRVLRNEKAPLKDRLTANEKLMMRAFGKVPTVPDAKKPDPKNPLSHLPPDAAKPKITLEQLERLNEAFTAIGMPPIVGGSPGAVGGGEAAGADGAAVQPADADAEAVDVPEAEGA